MKNKIKISGKLILINFKIIPVLILLTCLPSVSLKSETNPGNPTVIVKGLVRDAHTKAPLNAVQIKSLNSVASATTDENGLFTLPLIFKNEMLSVSTYNYQLREFPVQGKDSIVIELYKDKFNVFYKNLEDESGVVSNLFAIPAIKTVNNIKNVNAITLDELLQTELGGDVRAISRSGQAGMGVSMFVRGLNSINVNAQPLLVVDGVVWSDVNDVSSIHAGFFSNPLAGLDVNDIESITLLKDGASVYGSKASNGVLLVKTKRGNSSVTKINLNVMSGLIETPRTIPVMNADNYKTYVTDLLGTAGLTNAEIALLPYLNENPARSTYKTYHNQTNWFNQVYQNGMSKSYSINVNGGDEKALYYLTLGYTGVDGVVKTTDMERYSMRLNADIQMTEAVTLAANVGFSRIDRVLLDDGVENYTSPAWIAATKSPFLSPYNYTSLGTLTSEYAYSDLFDKGNPGAIIEYSNNSMKKTNLNISLKPTIRISPEINISEHFDYSNAKTNENYYRPYLFTTPVYLPGIGFSDNSRRGQVIRNTAIFSETRVNYTKQLNNRNKLEAFAGTRYIINDFEFDYVEGHNSGSNTSVNLLGSFKFLKTDGANDITKSLSHFINAEFSRDNIYFLKAAMSMDASSRFGNETLSGFQLFGHSWGVFPSLNGSWLMSSEEWMKNLSAVSLLKLRAGYGITGNDDIRDFQTRVYFSSIRFKDVANGAVLTNLYNPQIQWETTGRANLGLDMGLFNDRLMLNLDLYSSSTNNLLVLKRFEAVAGLNSYWSNGGSLSNRGFELGLNAKLLHLKDFYWEAGVTAGHYKNEITALSNETYSKTLMPGGSYTTEVYGGEVLTSTGHAAGVFYGYKTNGVFATKADAQSANLKIRNADGSFSSFGAGDVIFVDVPDANGVKDGIIDANDKQIIGDPNPALFGTISNKFTYKNLALSALFTYTYGNDVYNYMRSQLESGLDYSNQSTVMLNRWRGEGQITSQPRAVIDDPMGNARFSDRWIEDGSYLKLKSLTLSYNLPLESNFIEGVDLWISANNVLTLTKYLGVDPEFSSGNAVLFQGIDAGLLPLSRSYFVGLKFNL